MALNQDLDRNTKDEHKCTCPSISFNEEKCTCDLYPLDSEALCTCIYCSCSPDNDSPALSEPQATPNMPGIAPISIVINDSFTNADAEFDSHSKTVDISSLIKQLEATISKNCNLMDETLIFLKQSGQNYDKQDGPGMNSAPNTSDRVLRPTKPGSATSYICVNKDLVSHSTTILSEFSEIVPYREYSHQVTLEVKVTYLKVVDVDTLCQQFEAEVFIQAKWEEPIFLGWSQGKLDLLTPRELWEPYLIIQNIAGELEQERRSYIVRYEEGYEFPVVLHRWRFKGLFKEPLELEYFPFDVQDLTMLVSTERSTDEVKMKHDHTQLSSVNINSFQDSGEWSIYTHVECSHQTTNLEYASASIHPILQFQCRVRRRFGYFLWNIIFIVFLVLMLSFLTIAVESTTSDRLANTMTLFLTMVAFKLVVKQSLPTISYLTYLDIYVLGSLIYLVIFALENSAIMTISRWMDPRLVEDYDSFFCMCLVAILIVFHIIFIIHIQVTVLKRHRQMKENDKLYAIQARNLMLDAAKPKKPKPSAGEGGKPKQRTAKFADDPETQLLMSTLNS